MKLVMPMAGNGSRFKEKIKPLIDVDGVPMFVHSERCIGIDFEERIFIIKKLIYLIFLPLLIDEI